MRHTTKMLLVPEDVYKELVAAAAAAASRRQTASTATTLNVGQSKSNVDDNDDDGKLLTQTRKTMRKIVKNKRSNADERQIHLIQQFKRYKKLKADLEQRPVKVHVDNMEALIAAEKRRAHDLAKRSILKRQIGEFPDNLAPPLMENWADPDHIANGHQEEEEELRDPPQNVNKYQRRKLPSPNKVRLRTQIKPSTKARPYPDKTAAPAIARQHIFAAIKRRKKTADAGVEKLETPRVFKPNLWQQ